jgi:hypothetical protein
MTATSAPKAAAPMTSTAPKAAAPMASTAPKAASPMATAAAPSAVPAHNFDRRIAFQAVQERRTVYRCRVRAHGTNKPDTHCYKHCHEFYTHLSSSPDFQVSASPLLSCCEQCPHRVELLSIFVHCVRRTLNSRPQLQRAMLIRSFLNKLCATCSSIIHSHKPPAICCDLCDCDLLRLV